MKKTDKKIKVEEYYTPKGVWYKIGDEREYHPYPYWHGQMPFHKIELISIEEAMNEIRNDR